MTIIYFDSGKSITVKENFDEVEKLLWEECLTILGIEKMPAVGFKRLTQLNEFKQSGEPQYKPVIVNLDHIAYFHPAHND